jgi:hypothetical protein
MILTKKQNPQESSTTTGTIVTTPTSSITTEGIVILKGNTSLFYWLITEKAYGRYFKLISICLYYLNNNKD